jgi:hypothetical protein
MQSQLIEEPNKKWNIHSHARCAQSKESLTLCSHSIFSLSLADLRQANVEFLELLKEKINFHRSKRGTFHSERASAYDVALQELTQLLVDANA